MPHATRDDAWRAKAEELRVIAETIHHDGSRAMLLGLAEQYDRVARRAAGKPIGEPEQKAS